MQIPRVHARLQVAGAGPRGAALLRTLGPGAQPLRYTPYSVRNECFTWGAYTIAAIVPAVFAAAFTADAEPRRGGEACGPNINF